MNRASSARLTAKQTAERDLSEAFRRAAIEREEFARLRAKHPRFPQLYLGRDEATAHTQEDNE